MKMKNTKLYGFKSEKHNCKKVFLGGGRGGGGLDLCLAPVKIISLILSRVNRKVGWKWEIPEKKLPDHPQAEPDLSHMWPELDLNHSG